MSSMPAEYLKYRVVPFSRRNSGGEWFNTGPATRIIVSGGTPFDLWGEGIIVIGGWEGFRVQFEGIR